MHMPRKRGRLYTFRSQQNDNLDNSAEAHLKNDCGADQMASLSSFESATSLDGQSLASTPPPPGLPNSTTSATVQPETSSPMSIAVTDTSSVQSSEVQCFPSSTNSGSAYSASGRRPKKGTANGHDTNKDASEAPQKQSHLSKDYSRPLLIAGPGQYEDIETLDLIPEYPTKDAAVFELPLFRDAGPPPPRPPGWSMPSYYIRHQHLLRDEWCVKEYECDEEDRAWINYFQMLGRPKTHTMTESEFEAIIDRLEKEYYTLVEEEDKKEIRQKQEAQGIPVDADSNGSLLPAQKRRRHEGKLTVDQLEEKSKKIVERQRKNFKPMVPSWEALHCVGNYWQKKREQVRMRHAKQVEELMKGGTATWRNPQLFPLASLNACKSLILNYNSLDCRPYYTVCDHIFLIPRLQEEYKSMHNLNVSLGHRRPPRHPLDTANGFAALNQVRQQLETARCLLDRLSARERLKRNVTRLSVQTFRQELAVRQQQEKQTTVQQQPQTEALHPATLCSDGPENNLEPSLPAVDTSSAP